MSEEWNPNRSRLEGRTVLILAETPHHEQSQQSISTPVLEAEEAVMSVVRAVLAQGGRVRLIGDQSMILLASMVAGEYVEPFLDEREHPPSPLSVYTASEDRDESVAHLAHLGYANVYDRREGAQMLSNIAPDAAAMVCIGTGSSEEIEHFRNANSRAPIYVIASSGGGAAELAHSDFPGYGVEIIDRLLAHETELPRMNDEERTNEREEPLPPVALAAQIIVERLADERNDIPPLALA